MNNNIAFYMVPISPWTYLSMKRLKALSKKYHLPVKIKPIDLFYIFQKQGTKSVSNRPLAIQKNRINELKRWKDYLNIKLNVKPKYFPINPEKSCKLILASDYINKKNKTFELAYNLSEAVWVYNQDVSDDKTLLKIIKKLKYKEDLLEIIKLKNIKDLYAKNTEEALKNNVFGVPTFIFRRKLFWGQDRLLFLENEIKNNIDV